MELSVSLSKTGVSPILPRKAKMLGLERGKIGKKSVTRRQSKAELKEGNWGTEASFRCEKVKCIHIWCECKMIRTGGKAWIFAFKNKQTSKLTHWSSRHPTNALCCPDSCGMNRALPTGWMAPVSVRKLVEPKVPSFPNSADLSELRTGETF